MVQNEKATCLASGWSGIGRSCSGRWAFPGASAIVHKVFAAAGTRAPHPALVQLPQSWFGASDRRSRESGVCPLLKSLPRKPEHGSQQESMWGKLTAACSEVMESDQGWKGAG